MLITGSADGTSDRIVSQIGDVTFRFNYDLWRDYDVTVTPGYWSISNPSGRKIDSDTASACFWWKALSYFPGATDRHAKAEVKYFMRDLYGWFQSRGLAKGNAPEYHSAFGKMTILGRAKEYFQVPQTAFSIGLNGLDHMDEDLVVKSMSSEISDDNSVLMTTEIPSLESLDPKFPWFIQHKIKSLWDVTVFLCNGSLFAFKRSREALSGVDWRAEQNFKYEEQEWFPFELTPGNAANLLGLAQELNLEFGRFDFMSAASNLEELYFLEVNATGQWVFLDIENRYGLLKAVTDWLRS